MTSPFARNLSLAFLLAFPLAFLPLTITGFGVVKAAILAVFVIACAIALFFNRLADPGKQAFVTLIGVLASVAGIVTAISAFASPVPILSWYGDGFAADGALAMLALLGVFAVYKAIYSDADAIVRALTVFTAVWALVVVWEALRFILGMFGVELPSFGFFITPDTNVMGRVSDLSLFIGLGVAIVMVADRTLALARGVRIAAISLAAVSIILLFFMKFSITWYLLGIVGLAVICHALVFDKERRVPGMPLGLVLIAFSMIVGGSIIMNALYTAVPSMARVDRYVSTMEDIRPNLSVTMTVAKDVLREDPLLGTGPARFSRAVHASGALGGTFYGTRPVWNDDFIFGHSFLATKLVTEGILGFLAWAAFLGSVVWFSVRYALVAHRDTSKRFASLATAVSSVFVVGAIVAYPPSVVFLGVGFAFLGMATGLVSANEAVPGRVFALAGDRRFGFIHAFALVLGLLVTLVFGFMWIKKLAASHFLALAAQSAGKGEFAPSLNRLAQSAFFVPESITFRVAADLQRIETLRLAQQEGAQANIEAIRTLAGNAVDNASKAVLADPTHFANQLALARALAVGMPDTYSNTVSAYDAAKALAPRNPTVIIEQAVAEAWGGNGQRALQLVEEVIAINPGIQDAQVLRQAILQSMQQAPAIPNDITSVSSSTEATLDDDEASDGTTE